MTSPPTEISVTCPACQKAFETWHRASINLQLDHFDAEYIRSMTVKTCPHCQTEVRLETLIVGEDGVWRFSYGVALNALADRYDAFEDVDKSEFQRKARILQSLWREEQQFKVGEHKGRTGLRKLGSRLLMPDAQINLWNFLSDRIREVVRREVLDPAKSKGKLFGKPRIFNDLLSSQPLCFNLFGELQGDLKLATNVLRAVSGGRIHEVTSIEFEYSPGRGKDKCRYTDDSSAFDVYVTFTPKEGGKGFVGIEVKYHENLLGKAATHKDRYDEIADDVMKCFKLESRDRLKKQPLQQIWRDHLLAGVHAHVGGFEDGYFLLLHPKDNPHCTAAIDDYRKCITSSTTFASLTLEALVAEIRKHTDAEWVQKVYDRYLNFGKVEGMLHTDKAHK